MAVKCAEGLVDLHAVGWREALKGFGARQTALALGFGHLVQLVELLNLAILLGGRQAVEAGLLAEEPLLLADGQVLVLGHPLGQMTGRLGIGADGIRRIAVGRSVIGRAGGLRAVGIACGRSCGLAPGRPD
jgi:hypothetical protein